MAKKEKNTDLWVWEFLQNVKIEKYFSAQGSDILEIQNALKTASKRKTKNAGYPEYVGVIKDFLIVIEDKADIKNHIKLDENELISEDEKSTTNYAVNGALFYAKHLAQNTNYKKIIALGISGTEQIHKITPLFINERCEYKILDDLETFTNFSESNIEDYYIKYILNELTDTEKSTAEILKDAAKLHEDLRNYGNLEEKNKPLVVSGILLALREIEHKNFSIDDLNGDNVKTDGEKIYDAISANINRSQVSPDVKREKLLRQFLIIKDHAKINEINENLGKTPLKHYTEFLYENIFKSLRYISSAEDYLGRFYGEFMSYSGGDGQNLGIVLTPKHITELFCDLLELKPSDRVLDPCCGTAGFLIAAMHKMLSKATNEIEKNNIRKNQLFGIEEQSYMFSIATTNMILRGDGKSNLENCDFLAQNPSKLQLEKRCNIAMINPPYSMGDKNNPSLYEINFIYHLLNSVLENGKVAAIVPQSTFTGKTSFEKSLKEQILKKHTLEGVITLNKNTFYGVGTNPCIAVFTAHNPHPKDKICKFINYENDGFVVSKHIGLIDDGSNKDKKQHLLDIWFDKEPSTTKFCVKTTIKHDDEWLHSFYYFNDEIPSDEDFEQTIADYLTFEVNMITHGRGYLFGLDERVANE